jgi:TerC family integral membrane protein
MTQEQLNVRIRPRSVRLQHRKSVSSRRIDSSFEDRLNRTSVLFTVLIFAFTLLVQHSDAFSPYSPQFRVNRPLKIGKSLRWNFQRLATASNQSEPPSSNASSGSELQSSQLLNGDSLAAASVDASTLTAAAMSSNNNPPFLVTLDDGSQHSYLEAIQRTVAWVTAAIIFGSTLWITADAQTGQEFFAGYLVEQSLSVDNLFVFLLLFEYFKVPIQYQDRVLNWGIYGAIVMRAVMIGIGAAALQNFHAILLVFAAILVYSSLSFFITGGESEEDDPSQNSIVQFSRSLIQSTDNFDGDRFFTMGVDGIRKATPLFICMIAVEISDVVFAVDSIPAVFGVTEVRAVDMYCWIALAFVVSLTEFSIDRIR